MDSLANASSVGKASLRVDADNSSDEEFLVTIQDDSSDEDDARLRRLVPRREQQWTPHFHEQINMGVKTFRFTSCGETVEVFLDYHRHGTGSSVWDSAVVLMGFFENTEYFPQGFWTGKRVLELGAGTGIVGLLTAKLGAAHVVLTDLGDIVQPLAANIELNRASLAPSTSVAALEHLWGTSTEPLGPPFDVVLCADCLLPYAQEAMSALAHTIKELCTAGTGSDTQVLLAFEERFDVTPFFQLVQDSGLAADEILLHHLHPLYQSSLIHVYVIRAVPKAR